MEFDLIGEGGKRGVMRRLCGCQTLLAALSLVCFALGVAAGSAVLDKHVREREAALEARERAMTEQIAIEREYAEQQMRELLDYMDAKPCVEGSKRRI